MALKEYNWTAIATATIAIFTIALAMLQLCQMSHAKKVARVNYMVALHNKRMAVFFEIDNFLSDFMREGEPSLSVILDMRSKLRTAHFLFPQEALKFIDDMTEKTRKYHMASRNLHTLNKKHSSSGGQLSKEEEERREKNLNVTDEIEEWFLEQVQKKRHFSELENYLRLPATV